MKIVFRYAPTVIECIKSTKCNSFHNVSESQYQVPTYVMG